MYSHIFLLFNGAFKDDIVSMYLLLGTCWINSTAHFFWPVSKLLHELHSGFLVLCGLVEIYSLRQMEVSFLKPLLNESGILWSVTSKERHWKCSRLCDQQILVPWSCQKNFYFCREYSRCTVRILTLGGTREPFGLSVFGMFNCEWLNEWLFS